MITRKLSSLALLMLVFQSVYAIDIGDDGYYLLSSADDWIEFCDLTETDPHANAKMVVNIHLEPDMPMIGMNNAFQGTFDGQGHELNVSYFSSSADIAPFRRLDGALIERVRVTGSIESTYVSVGMVAITEGATSYIRQCQCSAKLTSGTGGIGNTIGGFVANNYGELVIEDCIFDGSIADKNRVYNAGFICNNYGSANISNCLNIGTFPPQSSPSGTFYRTDFGAPSLENVYYLNECGALQGTAVTEDELKDGTVTDYLQGGRTDKIWKQGSHAPMLTMIDYGYSSRLYVEESQGSVMEGETFQLTISTDVPVKSRTTIHILSEHPKKFNFPKSVVLEEGEESVTVDVTAIDDDLPGLPISCSFVVYAPGLMQSEAIVLLEDNDMPVLELELAPDRVSEGAGPVAVSAVLRRLDNQDKKITVRLTDDSNGGIYYALPTIEMAKGVEEVHFNLGPVDNGLVDGDRTYTITAAVYVSSCSCSASGESAGIVTAQLDVFDNDGPTLALSTAASTVKEGGTFQLTVTRNTPTDESLEIHLSSDDGGVMSYDPVVLIPSGERSAVVDVVVSPNGIQDDSKIVVFTAEAEGMNAGTCYVNLTDQSKPDVRILSFAPAELSATIGSSVTFAVEIANDGAYLLPADIPVKVYRKGESNAAAITFTKSPLEEGEHLSLTLSAVLPNTVGRHEYYAVVNEANEVDELSYANNISNVTHVQATAPYKASVRTDKSAYAPGSSVNIAGQLSGESIAGVEVDVYMLNDGARQSRKVTTDAKGAFSLSWDLLPLQSGHFSVGACYPGEDLVEAMASFDAYGLRYGSPQTITCEALVGEPFSGHIELSNPCNIALHGIRVEILDKPEHVNASFSTISMLDGQATEGLPFTLNSSRPSPPNEWETIKVRVVSDEGAALSPTIYYHNATSGAELKANIESIHTTMAMSEAMEYAFYISNVGKGETGDITILLPSWMRCGGASTIGSLKYGESVKVVLSLTPSDHMQVNVPLTGNIAINCENGNGIALPYSVTPVGNADGTMVVDVMDEYTFMTAEKPHLRNAHVIVKQPVTNTMVAEGYTDGNGIFRVVLPMGYYAVEVSADQHDSYANNILVTPEEETPVDVFLSFQAITYSWEVTETEVEDEYDIETTVTYDTRVPKPIVVVEYPEHLTYQDQVINITVANKGLVAAYNVIFDAQSELGDATFQPLIPLPIDTLPSMSSVTIPVLMHVASSRAYESQGSVGYGGTYYGDGEADASLSSSRVKKSSTDNIEEVSPGCWQLTIVIAHDHKECDKLTGKWVTKGKDYSVRRWLYGNCGNSGDLGEYTNIWIPGWWPKITLGGGDVIAPPSNPPGNTDKEKKKPNEDNNQKKTIIDGCFSDCEINAGKAAGGCPTFKLPPGWSCVAGLAFGCSGVSDLWGVADCVLAGLGCIPGPWGIGFSIAGCVVSIIETGVKCKEHIDATKQSIALKSPRRSKSISLDNLDPMRILIGVDSVLILKIKEILGEGRWDEVTGPDFARMSEYLTSHLKGGVLQLSDDRYDYKPSSLSNDEFDRFLQRLDNSNKKAINPDFQSLNVIDTQKLEEYDNELKKYVAMAVEMGYEDMYELNDSVESYVNYLIRKAEASGNNSVCATISLQLSQTMTMTRQAFRGTLNVFNGHPTDGLSDIKLELVVRDGRGKIATSHEFEMNVESLEGFEGETSLDAGWTLGANADGTATILFVPTKYAAPGESTEWSFGGTLTYHDPFTGLEVSRTLAPVTMTVKPSPEMDLHYFMQRDVYGDDPLTQDVEPMQPAEFALVIDNKGDGDAANVRMVTRQPQIVDNEKGLAIDFEIIGSQLNGREMSLAFGKAVANDFGDIPAHSQAYAQWWLQSSLLGHFTDYDVKVNHVSSYGNEDLSLVDKAYIHELIHGFTVLDGDGAPKRGFLVNDVADENDLPDMVYFSDASKENVSLGAEAHAEHQSGNEWSITITPAQTGWSYCSLPDPTGGSQRIVSIIRMSDGVELPADNFWQTDRILLDGQEWLYENRLHLVVNTLGEEDSYVVIFQPKPEMELIVERFTEVPADDVFLEEQLKELSVVFNKPIDQTTFTSDDIMLTYQGEKVPHLDDIIVTPVNETEYRLYLEPVTRKNGFYVLTVQTSGIMDANGFFGKHGKSVMWNQMDEKLGISNLLGQNGQLQVRITPIPVRDRMRVTGNFDQILHMTVYDDKGVARLTAKDVSNGDFVDVSSLQPGVYIVSFQTIQSIYKSKIVKR